VNPPEVPMAGFLSSVALEKYFRVYLLLSVRFYFIFLLCLIFCTGLFLIFIFILFLFYFILFLFYFIFWLSFLHSGWLSRDASYLPGGEIPPQQERKHHIISGLRKVLQGILIT